MREDQSKLLLVLNEISALQEIANQDIDALIVIFKKELEAEQAAIRKRNFIAPIDKKTVIYDAESDVSDKLKIRWNEPKLIYQIELFSAGAGLICDKLVPEFGVNLAIILNKKHYFGLNPTMHYFLTGKPMENTVWQLIPL